MTVHTLQIAVDIPADGHPISGHISDGSTPPETFDGWLGLLRALDELLSGTGPVAPCSAAEPSTAPGTPGVSAGAGRTLDLHGR